METGGCPHTAIRDDTTMNAQAIQALEMKFPDLGVMDRDSKLMRGARPFLFADLKSEKGLKEVIAWIERECLFAAE